MVAGSGVPSKGSLVSTRSKEPPNGGPNSKHPACSYLTTELISVGISAMTDPAPAWTPTQRQMAASLCDLADRSGQPSGEAGLMLVPTPLAELSARSGRGRNCGTVYAHVRALGAAVRPAPGRSGLLLHTETLRAIAGTSPSTPTGPGQAAAGFRPASFADPTPPVAAVGRSSVSALLRSSTTSQPDSTGQLVALVRDLIDLAHRVLDVAQTDQLADTGLLEGLRSEIPGLADDPRSPSRMIRDVADDPRDAVPPDQREGGSIAEETPGQKLPPSLSDPIRDVSDASAMNGLAEEVVACHAVADVADRQRSDEQLRGLIAPLTRLAERSNLVGLTDLESLGLALRAYNDAQVGYAVSATARMVRAGSVSKSPIGWLINKARAGDVNFFPPSGGRSTEHLPVPASAVEDPADAEGEAAVTTLESDPDATTADLEDLDSSIRGCSARTASSADRIFSDPSSLHAARVLAWRAKHPTPPLPRRSTNVYDPTARSDPAPIEFNGPRPAS